jgi:hypothetical protein
MRVITFVSACALIVAAGCQTDRSYRSADFTGERLYRTKSSPGPQLSESDVLGLKAPEKISEEDIRRVLDETSSIKISKGGTALVVQSGSSHPDKAMVQALEKLFTVVPHTGIPSEFGAEGGGDGISKALRLAAARSKAETILAYWGQLEMKREDLPTGIVSWVPVVDFMVPDEHQKMRMQLKVALIDVRTGNWATFRTEPIEEKALTTRYAREHEQKWPIEGMKARLYEAAVRKMVDSYVVASR